MAFSLILQVLERGIVQKISHFNGKELPIKAGQTNEPNCTYTVVVDVDVDGSLRNASAY